MWTFRGLGRSSFLREIALGFFRTIFPTGRIHKIRRGPLKGLKWHCHKEHQFWMPLGVYEKETTSWLEKHMKPDTIFYDIGANAGYFTLLGSQNAFRTYSFEPIPINVEVIKNHISENAITNVEVIPVALTDQVGIVRFVVASKNANSHLEDLDISHGFGQGILSVEGTTVDEFTKGNSPPSLLKIDVEGAELKVLEGARKCISEYAPDIILSTHSKKLKEDCRNFLQGLGYTVSELPGFVHELVATHNNNS